MRKPKVSIVIPVYNVESYLRRCVDSVLAQTLSDIEIILVDDGSPDGSPSICDEYAAANENVAVVHKSNGGLASARNAGMKIAAGDYLLFVDSDDWIDPETAGELVAVAEANQVDFVRFRPMYAGWPGHEDGSLCDFGTEQGMREGLYLKRDIEEKIYPRLFATPQLTLGVIVAAWRSLYRRKFLEENRLRFDEEVKYSEDTIFSARVVWASSSFYYLDGGRYYHYFYNRKSITKSFRADRWNSCKQLISSFERDFSNLEGYDFTDQLWLQKLYCIASALGQRSLISDKKERVKYCALICGDPVTISACRHLKLLRVPWKLRLEFLLIKTRASRLLAAV